MLSCTVDTNKSRVVHKIFGEDFFFINAVLVIRGNRMAKLQPSVTKATDLLHRLYVIEKEFGRDRNFEKVHWGPRSLDIDFLSWGNLHIHNSEFILPHPRIMERDFVLNPLAEALKKFGRKATLIQEDESFHPGWFKSNVDTISIKDFKAKPALNKEKDVIIMPETFMHFLPNYFKSLPKIIFNQNASYSFGNQSTPHFPNPKEVLNDGLQYC